MNKKTQGISVLDYIKKKSCMEIPVFYLAGNKTTIPTGTDSCSMKKNKYCKKNKRTEI